ncbi:bifunctional glutamate N-acetyltransferase/amino-acid acetyltransferase ArgJ [Novipirellula artificiosorum]|uniref:Arginine biosynthesis bifunctional protein ArgJ n=1 Tax=Novipirellula artificiosorum TaxID=2528016 RepID=A0A5C6DMF5_9BACT|nr:bifunctional glutamate N-acetyltransferase/amino-acid acetyltransferase ArgJ [Novipirellula artificiosorum]TWU36039.1 Arginine biosynthesis bifunctional protein ArgJ [Novipirellula artificiosorum]
MSKSSIYLPAGFRFAGVTCGIKASGKPDVSLIVSDRPLVAAGVYTTNQIVAAPVVLCRSRTPSSTVRAVVTNSGNANACTGSQGDADAKAMCAHVASLVGCDETDVLVMSTGVIGKLLPMEKVKSGIEHAVAELADREEAFFAAAEAIRTTDKDRKTESRELELGGESIRIAAMAKGAGMIAPNMATMLSVICTDASIEPKEANAMLRRVARVSYNRVSVDGHTSTNDTLLLLASGTGTPLQGDSLCLFEQELTELAIQLAKQLVEDGEGATHVMQIRVTGATNDASAETIAKTVAASPLVKTAITGGDPNWGRMVSAAGYAGEPIEPAKVSLRVCEELIYENGTPLKFDAASLSATMKEHPQVNLDLCVGGGNGEAVYWSSDLTTDYVRFNSEYTT